jgi:ribosomal protein S18 acetylase RimI-like enzyme
LILFSAIDHEDCLSAYHWHRGFSGANDALFPRQFDDFEQLVLEGSVWAARDSSDNYLALAYASFNAEKKECEVGGLMVATQARNKGLGAMMMRLALIHILLEEDLLADPAVRVVAHVLKSNPARRVGEDPRRCATWPADRG